MSTDHLALATSEQSRLREEEPSYASTRFAHDAPVLQGRNIDPKRLGRIPLFGDDMWDLSSAIFRENAHRAYGIIDFTLITNPIWRITAKEYLYARLTVRLPGKRKALAVTGCYKELLLLRRFAEYLSTEQNGMRLREVSEDVLYAYREWAAMGRRGQGVGAAYLEAVLQIPVKLFRYRDYLSHDQLIVEPWAGLPATKVAGVVWSEQNSTPRIPEHIMGPTLQWAIQYVQVYAVHILHARDAVGPTVTVQHRQPRKVPANLLEEWVSRLRASGRGVPRISPEHSSYRHREEAGDPLALVYKTRLLAEVGLRSITSLQSATAREILLAAVDEFGWDDTTSGREALVAVLPDTPKRTFNPVSIADRLRTWVDGRRQAGSGLPKLYEGDPGYARKRNRADDPLRFAHLGHIAREAGIPQSSMYQDEVCREILLEALQELGYEKYEHSPESVLTRGRVFSGMLLREEEQSLFTACYIIIAYLSGMRDSEVQSLRVGCHSVRRSTDGLVKRRYLRGIAYKGHGAQGREEEWVVIEPVALAVSVLESMAAQRGRGAEGDLLFIRPSGHHPHTNGQVREDINRYLNRFRERANQLAVDRQMPSIPDVDGVPWHFTTVQFRRTVAWHIANRPFGTIAGKIQYKHASVAMFEGYAGTSASGFRADVDGETALARLTDIVERYEDFERGVRFTGRAASRVTAEFVRVREECGGFAGIIADPARHRAMLQHLATTLHPALLNDCYFEPAQALCVAHLPEPQRKQPLVGHCDPINCTNSCISERHLPLWKRSAAYAVDLLSNKRLPILQATAIRNDAQRLNRVIALFQER